ncbi:hypothetical protein JHK85_010184 [Glycine max]|nr:hypothetical protein JHK85_010184 [Glycine max]
MKEFGMVDSWTMLLKVNCEGLQFFNYYYYQQFPLWMTENGDFLLLDNRLEQIESRTNVGLLNSFDYAQSLFSIVVIGVRQLTVVSAIISIVRGTVQPKAAIVLALGKELEAADRASCSKFRIEGRDFGSYSP